MLAKLWNAGVWHFRICFVFSKRDSPYMFKYSQCRERSPGWGGGYFLPKLSVAFFSQTGRPRLLATWLNVTPAARCPLVFFLQYHFMQCRVDFLGRPLHEPLSICSNPQQSGGLANVTRSLHLSNEWVKFKFWANYLFEALPASQKWFRGRRR